MPGLFSRRPESVTRQTNSLKAIPADCKEDDIECHFPDLPDKHPDCSVVSDYTLLDLTQSRWQSTTIPYSISESEPKWIGFINKLDGYKDMHARSIHPDVRDAIEKSIVFALEKFTAASNGTLQFVKKATFHNRTPFISDVFSRGITFMFPGSEKEIGDTTNSGGFTLWRFDNNGDMKDAAVYLPNDYHYWHYDPDNYTHYTWLHSAIGHEIEHALGIKDWTEPYLLESIQQIPDGVYCSIMPYPARVTSNTSACNITTLTCNPPYAVFPAQLDNRWIDLTYQKQAWKPINYDGFDSKHFANENFYNNSKELIAFAFFFTVWHQVLLGLTTGYASKTRHPERNKKLANFVADAAMMFAMLSCEMPWQMELIFGITSLNKYLPERLLNKIPEKAGWVATASYNNFSSIMYAIVSNGTKYSRFGTFSLALLAMLAGFVPKMLAHFIGKSVAQHVNPVDQAEPLDHSDNAAAESSADDSAVPDYSRLEEASSPGKQTTQRPLQWMSQKSQPADTLEQGNENQAPALR